MERGAEVEDFTADAAEAGPRLSTRLSTLDLRPASDDFLVGILEHG